MNILGFNISISRTPAAQTNPQIPQRKSTDIWASSWLRGKDLEEPSVPPFSNAYEQVVWVYRAINALAEQVANTPFVFSRGERGRENLITSGPLVDFYRRPHPRLNRFQYWELRVLWLMLRGECIRILLFSEGLMPLNSEPSSLHSGSKRRLTSVLFLDPARFQHIVDDHQLVGWRYTGAGLSAPLASQVFLPEEVWFERLPNPFDFWRGLAPLAVADMAVRSEHAAGAFMRGVLENNADNGLVVRSDQWLSDEQQEQVIAALRDRKRRAGVADRPLFLCGVSEIAKPELTSSDLQFLDNRKFSRAEICAAFGVPEEIITATDHAKYDVMRGARLNFIENRVVPLCRRLEAEEEATVKALDPQASGWFDLESIPVMQQAQRERLAAARAGFEMGVPFNELNKVFDLGFRPLPWGDRGFVPGALKEQGATDAPRNQERAASTQAAATSPEPGAAVAATIGEVDLMTRATRLLASLEPASPPVLPSTGVRRVRRFFFEQRQRALAALRDPHATPLNPANEEMQLGLLSVLPVLQGREQTLQALNRIVCGAVNSSLDEGRTKGEPADQLAARIRAIYNEVASAIESSGESRASAATTEKHVLKKP